MIPYEDLLPLQVLGVQLLALIPLITLSFMVLYGILFVIGETAQYSSSELINYMPITAFEYVLASSFSTVFTYSYIVIGIFGISLSIALQFGLFQVWVISTILSIFFMVTGGFVGEIIRAIVNRVSSTFSKRGGRSAIAVRLVLIVFVLLLVQISFNPNILYMILQQFAPQMYVLWFVPVMWPTIAIMDLFTGSALSALLFTILSLLFGLALMGIGVILRKKYWVPLPVTIKLSNSKNISYSKSGLFSKIGYSQAEAAIISKDVKSLFRRKEMVRFLALPIIIIVPMLLTTGTMEFPEERYMIGGMMCVLGSGMFGIFLSLVSIAQEQQAIWNLFSAPIDAEELFKSKISLPLYLSLIPAIVFPSLISLIFNFNAIISLIFIVETLLLTIVSVLVGGVLGPKYMELEERPRSNYVTATGMFLAFIFIAIIGIGISSPLLFYLFMKPLALLIGMSSLFALVLSVVIGMVISVILYKMAYLSVSRLFEKSPLE